MEEEPIIDNAIVAFHGKTSILSIKDNIQIQREQQEDPGCYYCSKKFTNFTCPRDRVIGAETMSNCSFRIHYAEPVEQTGNKPRFLLHETDTIDLGRGSALQIVERIRRWVCGIPLNANYRKNVILIVNPKSGSGRALKILNKRVLPLVTNVLGWVCQERVTSERGEAESTLKNANLANVDMVVIIGGDGTFHEALQGFMKRNDRRDYLHLPFVPIPAGSGNALATTLGLYDVDTALFAILKNQLQQLDIISISQCDTSIYSFLGVMYGTLSAIDIESERYRWLGSSRFAVSALKQILKMPEYDAKFAYLPYEVSSEFVTQEVINQPGPSRIGNRRPYICNNVRDWFNSNDSPTEGPHGWIMAPSSRTRFLAVLNLPYISENHHFMPRARINDGALYLIQLPVHLTDTRRQMLEILRKSETGDHLDLSSIHCTKIRAFLILPGVNSTWLTVDGEIVSNKDYLSMELMPRFITVLSHNAP